MLEFSWWEFSLCMADQNYSMQGPRMWKPIDDISLPKACTAYPNTMNTSQQTGSFQLSSALISPFPVSKIHGASRNKILSSIYSG